MTSYDFSGFSRIVHLGSETIICSYSHPSERVAGLLIKLNSIDIIASKEKGGGHIGKGGPTPSPPSK